MVLEQPGENPFLARFYEDMARFALPTQLFFLFQRSRLLEPLAQPDMFGRPVVADFLIDKDPLFADRKSTRLNSSHSQISYAVFCLKKKKRKTNVWWDSGLGIVILATRCELEWVRGDGGGPPRVLTVGWR